MAGVELSDSLDRLTRKGLYARRLDQLEEEQTHRKALPEGHPARVGGTDLGDEYPIVFDMDTTGLRANQSGNEAQEAEVFEDIDLKTRLRRVYVPLENKADARARLEGLLGHGDFEVIALEAFDALRGGALPVMRAGVTDTLREHDARFQAMQHVLVEAKERGEPVDTDEARARMHQHIEAAQAEARELTATRQARIAALEDDETASESEFVATSAAVGVRYTPTGRGEDDEEAVQTASVGAVDTLQQAGLVPEGLHLRTAHQPAEEAPEGTTPVIVEVGEPERGAVASYRWDDEAKAWRVTVAAGTPDHQVARAIAHEIAEIGALPEGALDNRGIADTLVAGKPVKGLSPHDLGRLAELRVLARHLDDPPPGVSVGDLRRDMAELMGHLGLAGDRDADARLALVREHLHEIDGRAMRTIEAQAHEQDAHAQQVASELVG